ncbi:MAG: polyribonucleotide nucleotidyltransferase [FCB group bacterium]|nr:polyribonucleotide nucleotidyltransferase [FCB group bacterium]
MIEVSREIGGRKLTIQTGKVARQAAGSVIVSYGESTIITAVNAAKEIREDIDFFPLQVEYRERHYAGGKIPGGFFKREARPSEKEVLTSRVTDRPIRPLFPKGFRYETQVVITALTSDGENPTDILAGIGASTALMISDIPWNGPIATVRVGLLQDEFVINPTREQMVKSSLDLTVSGNEQTVVMVEGEAEEVPESTVVEALKFAHETIREIIELQKELIAQVPVEKRPVPEEKSDPDLEAKVLERLGTNVQDLIKITDKKERESATRDFRDTILTEFEELFPEQRSQVKEIFETELKKAFRERILSDGIRSDGRKTDEIRPITIDTGFLPRTHGSVLFTRGETQALVVLTLGTKSDEQIIDSMDEDYKKHYMLHYNFPPYCVGEVGRIGFTSRREIGHGNLAERSLKPIMPSYEEFPYTIRIVSEIMESNGSSSMASVCGGSLALLDAGVPAREHVAGIAMGLILDGERHAVLSDIMGAEDHLGDMDFKVTGTKSGITAIQLDLKIEGLSFELLTEALEQARQGREYILGLMNEALPEPKEMSPHAPRIMTIQINPEKIGGLIGPGGKNIKKIIADTECSIDVDDTGTVVVANPDARKCQDAVDLIQSITMDPEVGDEFDGTVTRLMTFGAFVEFAPGREGLVHISELDWNRTERVEDVVKVGDKLKVRLIRIDDQGRFDFSHKVLLPKPEGYVEPQRNPDRSHGGGSQHRRGNYGGHSGNRRRRF